MGVNRIVVLTVHLVKLEVARPVTVSFVDRVASHIGRLKEVWIVEGRCIIGVGTEAENAAGW